MTQQSINLDRQVLAMELNQVLGRNSPQKRSQPPTRKLGSPIAIIPAIATIAEVLGVVALFRGTGTIGGEAEVAAAIQAVEDQVGLTEDIKWAWSWFDRRYYRDLGNSWKGYCYYAGHYIGLFTDVAHWKNCTEHCLRQIEYYLNRAALAAEPVAAVAGLPAFLDKLKRYAPYIALGGGLILSAILIARATKKER